MPLIYFFSLLPLPVLAVTAIVMYQRKQHLIYPIFWTYLIFQFVRESGEGIALQFSHKVFYYTYWSTSACSVIFSLLLLRNIFLTVLRGYSPLSQLRRYGYEAMLLACWLLALLVAFHNEHPRTVRQLIFDSHQAVSFTSVGMFVFVVGSSALLGIRWTSAICGIALGLGLFGTTDLVVYALLSHGHLLSNTVASWIQVLAYDCGIGIFALYFVPRREEVQVPAGLKPELLQWANEVRGSLSK
ncbi:MAG: hypothetical protein DMG60_19415 [Acidobacteria bacterium]|nr:MAG: hypothetical protein DMG60_19415 [Acidobacteriota bacterium]